VTELPDDEDKPERPSILEAFNDQFDSMDGHDFAAKEAAVRAFFDALPYKVHYCIERDYPANFVRVRAKLIPHESLFAREKFTVRALTRDEEAECNCIDAGRCSHVPEMLRTLHALIPIGVHVEIETATGKIHLVDSFIRLDDTYVLAFDEY
jgi:hypothetical protein